MLALRALSRAIPRSALRHSATTYQSLAAPPRACFFQTIWSPNRSPIYSSFSTSSFRHEPATDSDQELSAKLNREIQLEQSSRDSAALPESIQAYLDRSGFQVHDLRGTQDVVLSKQFENETVKVEFSIADINSMAEEMEDIEDDAALEDEEFETATTQQGRRSINQSKAGPIDAVPEDSVAPADREAPNEEEEAIVEDDRAVPINLRATITKSAGDAIQVHARAEDGVIQVEEVYYYPSAELADASTSEEAKQASSLYLGPPFVNLDPDLCSMLERYVDERGVNSDLAIFLPEYVDYKEQRGIRAMAWKFVSTFAIHRREADM